MSSSRLLLRARPAARGHRAGRPLDAPRDVALGDGSRAARIRVPAGVPPDVPAPLALLLHGSGADPEQALGLLGPYPEAAGVVLVAPAAADYTWDMIAQGRFGPDVEAIDRALEWVFQRRAIDARRLAIGGFSDGASYALSLAVANAALFSHVIALSPGFMAGEPLGALPRIFLAHGRADRVLPVACSRRIVPVLRGADADLRYEEFDGGHEVPPAIAESAVRWLVGD
jgi:phospholipase/carboxylesterase